MKKKWQDVLREAAHKVATENPAHGRKPRGICMPIIAEDKSGTVSKETLDRFLDSLVEDESEIKAFIRKFIYGRQE